MLKPSSTSVQIHWLDSHDVIRRLNTAARQMKARHPEIERVLLFGSLARGEAVPGSDADLLIILSSADRPIRDRIARYLPEALPISVDIFPYTGEEIDRMLAEGNHLIRRALNEGLELAREDAST